MSNLLLLVLKSMVAAMVAIMSPENVKAVIDKAFDMVEQAVADSASEWDDVLVLPMVKALREALSIPKE